jgi:hypothetical protein
MLAENGECFLRMRPVLAENEMNVGWEQKNVG